MKSIDGIILSKIDSVDDEKVFAEIENNSFSLSEIVDRIINIVQFKGVIEVYELLVEVGKYTTYSYRKASYIKGIPVTKLALVLFNDKGMDYSQYLYKILLDYNCYNITIEPMVSKFGRKYYLAKFDTNGVDIRDLDHFCQKTFQEDTLFSINRNNKFDYEECLLDNAKQSMTPTELDFKVIKQKNYFDFSGDDSSLDPRLW